MAPHGRSPSSTRTGAGNKRCPLGSPRARPSSAPCPREARGSVCPPCGEDAARRERPDSPAPAYELHDLTERLITVGRAEHRARVFASAEEYELLRGACSGKAPQDVRRGPERVAIGAHKELAAGDLLRELVRDGRDRRRDSNDALDIAFEARREHRTPAHRRADERDFFDATIAQDG